MTRLLCLPPLLLLALSACDSSPSASAKIETAEEPTSSAPSDDPDVVRLSPAALQRAGITVQEVEEVEIAEELSFPGRVELNADRTVRAAAFVEGIVVECCKTVGSVVNKGEVLVEFHSHQTHELLAEYRQANAVLEARESERAFAENDFKRASRLRELKAGSLQRVQETETALSTAEAAVESAKAALAGALAHFEYLGIDTTEIERGEIPDHLEIVVKAPIDGVVVERSVTLGSVVNAGQELYEISDLSQVWVMAQVPEAQLAAIRPGMRVEVAVGAYPDRTFGGRVERIDDKLDPHTKTVQVRCVIPNPGRALKSAMYAQIKLRSNSMRTALLVPNEAVQRFDDGDAVFVEEAPGVFRRSLIETKKAPNGRLEAVEGLSRGQKTAVAGAFILKSELLKAEFGEE